MFGYFYINPFKAEEIPKNIIARIAGHPAPDHYPVGNLTNGMGPKPGGAPDHQKAVPRTPDQDLHQARQLQPVQL